MKRLLRKLGRTIESATTQPLWITFRHALVHAYHTP